MDSFKLIFFERAIKEFQNTLISFVFNWHDKGIEKIERERERYLNFSGRARARLLPRVLSALKLCWNVDSYVLFYDTHQIKTKKQFDFS